MNISSVISSIYQLNSSTSSFLNGTKLETNFGSYTVIYTISIFMIFPINSYVIWLIVTGTGNGLAAEFFILNLCVFKILFCLELLFICFPDEFLFLTVALFLDGLGTTGRPLFECLICVERYLAVIHPVIFLKYKPLRYRLMCSAVVWVVTFATGGISTMVFFYSVPMHFGFLVLPYLIFLSIQLFCCLAVLRALKQSGPGERAREREENNMKRRAFYLILITTVNMVVLYAPYIILLALLTKNIHEVFICLGQMSFVLAGLVQPVLFIYRVGKLNFISCQ